MVEFLHHRTHGGGDVSIVNNPITLGVELALAMDPQFVAVTVKATALVTNWHFGELMCGFKCEVLPEFKCGVEPILFIHSVN